GSALRHLGGVVDEQRPGPDRVVEARAGLGPRVIDLAHTRGGDYPKGVEPAVRQHGPDLGGAGGHQSRVGAHGLPVTALAPCQPLGGRGRSSGPAGHRGPATTSEDARRRSPGPELVEEALSRLEVAALVWSATLSGTSRPPRAPTCGRTACSPAAAAAPRW